MRNTLTTGLIGLSLLVSSIISVSVADDRKTDELREKVAALMNQAEEASDAGHKKDAAELRKKAEGLLQAIREQQAKREPERAERRERPAGEGFERRLHEINERIADLLRGGRQDAARRLQAQLHDSIQLHHGKHFEEAERLLDAARVELDGPGIDRRNVVAEIRVHDERREEPQGERIEHLHQAVEHLRAAGLHDEAEHVLHRAEELEQEHGHHEHDRAHEELHHRVRELSEEVDELHERLGRIEKLLTRIGSRRD
ncbi:MAG: hypothetical protein CMJ64_16190 [Planctomycetaceae bacterium]|nr:hypothetical protein [Planctomycetaceae bacterium]